MADTRAQELGKGFNVYSIIFIDEIDSLARSRQNDPSGTNAIATNALLQMMDGFQQLESVLVIGATNYPWSLDGAILSRFNAKIHVKLPDTKTIHDQLKFNLVTYVDKALPAEEKPSICQSDKEKKSLPRRVPVVKKSNWWKDEFDLLAPILGVTNDELFEFAKRHLSGSSTTTTHSPSNVKDICNKVFVSSSMDAQQIDRFHKIVLVKENATLKDIPSLLLKMEGLYACAATYKRLKTKFPQIIRSTDVRSANTSVEQPPGKVTLTFPTAPTEEFISIAEWCRDREATIPASSSYQGLLHVYIQQPAKTDPSVLSYSIHKTYHLATPNTCTPLKATVVLQGDLSLKSFLQSLKKQKSINIFQDTVDELLADGIFQMAIRFPHQPHMTGYHVLDGVRIEQLETDTDAGMNFSEETLSHQLCNTPPEKMDAPVQLQVEGSTASTADTNIGNKCFSLALKMPYFQRTVDSSSVDIVAPSETLANVKKLDTFERTGDIEKNK
jgi:hypothetical protein